MKIKHRQRLSMFPFLVILPVLLMLGLDTFGNSASVAKLLNIHSHQIVIPVLLITLTYRYKMGSFISGTLKKILVSSFILGVVVGSAITFYDALTPPNAAFNLTRLHQDQLWLLTVFLGLILLMNQASDWWKKNWTKVLFLIPFAGFYTAFVTSLFPFDVFLQLVKEDHIIENGQFWILFLGSLSILRISLQLSKTKIRIWSLFFGFFSLAFFFVAGDEISWGQRLLGIEVNEAVKEINRQGEMTIHNLYAVEWLVIYGYFSISLFGVFSHMICSRFKIMNQFIDYVPNNLLIGYFLLPLLFYTAQLRITGGIWHAWSEVAELYFYSGLVLWILLLGRKKMSALRSTPN